MSGYQEHTLFQLLYVFASFNLIIFLSTSVVTAQEPEEILDKAVIRPAIVNLPDYGRIQGKREYDFDFYGGIPYAAPPVFNLRFAPPDPPAPWAPALLDGSKFGPDCWQLVDPLMNPGVNEDQMSEDCLYLNVYTPAGQASRKSLLPVMVWLHGGAFQQGGARRPEYDGRRLAERGNILVTINYRLGALGFMVSSPDGLFGNFGLMDQRAALHWVKDNIRCFGGDPDNVTLFGESAGAVMTGLHLMMEGAGKLFHKAIIQSNPLGLQFRSVVVADFIGEALKHSVDCRDLACLRAERVEEIMRAQSSLMGVPRSVGDFFTWGPTLTSELKLTLGGRKPSGSSSPLSREHSSKFRDLDSWQWQMNRDTSWSAVNVSQPLKNFERIPDSIPVILGTNKHEGEMFVHGAFPITMTKAVYWMFVGALFRDSASRVLKHYRGYVDQIEKEAEELSRKQVAEEENRQYYLEHQDQLDLEYQRLVALNSSKTNSLTRKAGVEALFQSWSRGGAQHLAPWHRRLLSFGRNESDETVQRREHRRREREKKNALKEAAKVVVDYRPVVSRIIDDYLFRCPTWHLAHSLSRHRLHRGHRNNVYVYQFSHSTHIPGFKECWGKSCHTAEIPYVFQAMEIIRSNYSTLGPHAQTEAPAAPEYPYSDILAAYREAEKAAYREEMESSLEDATIGHASNSSLSKGFQNLLQTFFGDYFKEDADEETASDMANRWVAFSRTGDPNYSGSRADWRPWRYVFDDDMAPDHKAWDREAFDQIFHDDDECDIDAETPYRDNNIEGYLWSEDPQEQAFRRRALKALGMKVAEEDVFQTWLLRTPKSPEDNKDNPFRFLFKSGSSSSSSSSSSGGSGGGSGKDHNKVSSDEERMTRRAIRQLQQIAQDMGLLGKGLMGEPVRRGGGGSSKITNHWVEDFFPEVLDIKWPPEGRLVERDCTCDMWDRIRYRY